MIKPGHAPDLSDSESFPTTKRNGSFSDMKDEGEYLVQEAYTAVIQTNCRNYRGKHKTQF